MRIIFKYILLLSLFVLPAFFSEVYGQLVNIESKRMQTDSLRFVFTGDLLFNYTKNNSEYVLQIGSNITAQFKSKNLKKIYFLIGDYTLVQSQTQDFQNSWFLHARYNQQLSSLLRLEAFIQNQNNTKLTVTQRNLIGAGIRLKLISKEYWTLYFGNSYMYEIETIASTQETFYNHRNSSYASLNRSFEKLNLIVAGTLYFQPLYNNIGDHRILVQCKANVPLSEKISLSALYNYFYTNFSSELLSDRSANINIGCTLKI